jgi:glucose/arabinose dehydrogenase
MNTTIQLFTLLVGLYFLHADVQVDKLKPRAGFKASTLTLSPEARQLALTDDNTLLFVGGLTDTIMGYRLARNDDGTITTKAYTLATGLSLGSGVVFDEETSDLFFSQYDGIYVFRNIRQQMDNNYFQFESVKKFSFANMGHGRKYLGLHNNRIFYPVGSPCNSCDTDELEEEGNPYGTLNSIQKDGSDLIVHARGIRDCVGMTFRYDQLWFSENGRDGWGDDLPREEINVLQNLYTQQHFGFPYCHEKGLADPDYNKLGYCNSSYTGASFLLNAHVAPLGMTFYKAGSAYNKVPQEFRGEDLLIVAEHGSWDRTVPDGYRLVAIDVSNPYNPARVFLDGFLLPEEEGVARKVQDADAAWGRPNDVVVMNDGSLLVSDDKAGAIYHLVYDPANPYYPMDEIPLREGGAIPEVTGAGAPASILPTTSTSTEPPTETPKPTEQIVTATPEPTVATPTPTPTRTNVTASPKTTKPSNNSSTRAPVRSSGGSINFSLILSLLIITGTILVILFH